jgi:uncharacterized integral membrane protein
MFRVILSIVILVIVVVLIVLNLGYTTSFNFFGWKFEQIPVTAVALVSFAVGVLYSFAYYLGRYLNRISKKRSQKRGEQVKAREQELEDRQRELEERIEEVKQQPREGAATVSGPEVDEEKPQERTGGGRKRKKR